MSGLVFVFDADGTLTEPGDSRVPEGITKLLARISIPSVVASGRGAEHCEEIRRQICGHGWFAENAYFCQFRGEEVRILGNGDVSDLKRAVGFTVLRERVATLTLDGRVCVVPFEPKQGILTLRPLDFGAGLDPRAIRILMEGEITRHGLKVEVIGPHPDGGLDFLPFANGGPLNKGIVPRLLRKRFPKAKIAVFGDGEPDIPMAELADLVVTFANGHPDLQALARERGGIVVPLPGPKGGCAQGIKMALERLNGR